MGERLSSPSPELITDGTVAKCWKRYEDGIYLLKRGTRLSLDENVYGYGPYSELYTYELAKNICHDPLPYSVVRYHGKTASKCRLFCDENTSYAPAAYVVATDRQTGNAKLSECIDFFDSIGSGEEFREMLVLDALTFNEDRHMKNFGVLYNADSMCILGMAPVFDNNLALFPNNRTEEMQNIDSFLLNRISAFGLPFHDLAKKCMTPQIRKKLINLQGFTFSKNANSDFDESRLQCLEKIISRQIDIILDKKTVSIPNKIHMDNIAITLKARPNINPDRLQIKDNHFTLVTKDNNLIKASECRYDINTYSDNIEIDIYEAVISGTAGNLSITEIKNLVIEAPDGQALEFEKADIQLNNGFNITQSTIEK